MAGGRGRTAGALQAVAGHAQLGGEGLEGGYRALDGVHQEERPLLALHGVEARQRGAGGVHQHQAQVRLQQHAGRRAVLRRGLPGLCGGPGGGEPSLSCDVLDAESEC